MCDCGVLSPEGEEILNHQIEVELGEYGVGGKLSDSEYKERIAKIAEEEIAQIIELNRQTQEIEPSSLLG